MGPSGLPSDSDGSASMGHPRAARRFERPSFRAERRRRAGALWAHEESRSSGKRALYRAEARFLMRPPAVGTRLRSLGMTLAIAAAKRSGASGTTSRNSDGSRSSTSVTTRFRSRRTPSTPHRGNRADVSLGQARDEPMLVGGEGGEGGVRGERDRGHPVSKRGNGSPAIRAYSITR